MDSRQWTANSGQWTVRDDVWVWYRPENGPVRAGALTVGFTVYGGKHPFGPQLQFGHVIGDCLSNQVLLIKAAWGGKSLFKDLRPPSSGGQVGPYYTQMIEEVRGELCAGQRQPPDLTRGGKSDGTPALSGEMFADGIRVGGLQLLAKHRIKEGMRVAIAYAKNQNPWASQDRMWEIMKALKSYGAAAKDLLPELKELAAYCKTERNFPSDCRRKKTAAVEDAIKAIEEAKDQPRLRSIAPSLQPRE